MFWSIGMELRSFLHMWMMIKANQSILSATHVPVGKDQTQHLEFARECATNFNHAYGKLLPLPETIFCM